MAKHKIFITAPDRDKLLKLIEQTKNVSQRDERLLKDLAGELERAKVVASHDIPENIITMNSQVRLKDMNKGDELTFTLVYPNNADAGQNKISVLAPIGTALIGQKVGDVIEWKVPAGMAKFKVEQILYQPETAGEYDL